MANKFHKQLLFPLTKLNPKKLIRSPGQSWRTQKEIGKHVIKDVILKRPPTPPLLKIKNKNKTLRKEKVPTTPPSACGRWTVTFISGESGLPQALANYRKPPSRFHPRLAATLPDSPPPPAFPAPPPPMAGPRGATAANPDAGGVASWRCKPHQFPSESLWPSPPVPCGPNLPSLSKDRISGLASLSGFATVQISTQVPSHLSI